MPEKDTELRLRISAADKAALEDAAKRESLSLSAWVRSTLLKIARKKGA